MRPLNLESVEKPYDGILVGGSIHRLDHQENVVEIMNAHSGRKHSAMVPEILPL